MKKIFVESTNLNEEIYAAMSAALPDYQIDIVTSSYGASFSGDRVYVPGKTYFGDDMSTYTEGVPVSSKPKYIYYMRGWLGHNVSETQLIHECGRLSFNLDAVVVGVIIGPEETTRLERVYEPVL